MSRIFTGGAGFEGALTTGAPLPVTIGAFIKADAWGSITQTLMNFGVSSARGDSVISNINSTAGRHVAACYTVANALTGSASATQSDPLGRWLPVLGAHYDTGRKSSIDTVSATNATAYTPASNLDTFIVGADLNNANTLGSAGAPVKVACVCVWRRLLTTQEEADFLSGTVNPATIAAADLIGYYTFGTDSGSTEPNLGTNATGDLTLTGTAVWDADQPTFLGADPVITSVGGDNVVYATEQNVVIVGSNFGTTQGTVYISDDQESIVSWTDTEIVFNVSGLLNTDSRCGPETLSVETANGIGSKAITLDPPPGYSYVNITSLVASSLRIQTSPAMQVGWQLGYQNYGGNVEVFSDGSFKALGDVPVFDGYCHSGTSWGTVGPQTLLAGEPPAILTTTLPAMQVDSTYGQQLSASGALPISWAVTSGSLPAGLTLSAEGFLEGVPTAAGSYDFTATATNTYGTDAFRYLGTVTASTPAPIITTTELPQFYVGVDIGVVQIDSTPTMQEDPTMRWSIVAGDDPAGLNFSSVSGQLTGTPTTAGPWTFTARLTSDWGTDDQVFSGNVLEATVAPVITTATLTAMVVGTAFSQQLAATGTAPIAWAKFAGTIPAGLTLSTTGLLSGTPTTAGAYDFTVDASNSAGYDTQQYIGTITAALTAPVITTTALNPMSQGVPFSQQLQATGNPAPTFAVSAGSLPTGLTLTSGGLLSGTPIALGAYNFTVTATNSQGSDPQVYTGSVNAAPAGDPNATLNGAILAITGGPTVNEGLFNYFGGSGTTLQERERDWLEGLTAVRGSIEDMWHDYLYNVRGYSGSRNDMELRFWRDGGAAAPASVVTKGYTAVWNQFAASACGYRLNPAGGSLSPNNLFAGDTIAQLAVTDNDFLYLLPLGGVQFPDIVPGFVWFSYTQDEFDTITLEWDNIDRYVAMVDGAYAQAQSNIGLPVRVRLSGDTP